MSFIAEVIVIQNMYLGKLVTSNIYKHLTLLKVYIDNTVSIGHTFLLNDYENVLPISGDSKLKALFA